MSSLHILQYNMHKAKDTVMATFLRDPKVLKATIIAAQEPWRNNLSDTTHQPAAATHQLLYPKSSEYDDKGPPRVALFVAKSVDPDIWSHTVVSRDYQILSIRYHRGNDARVLYLHNIYNEPRSGTIQQIQRQLEQLGTNKATIDHILVGDMNAHHPAWGGPGTRIDPEAEILLEIMDRFNIELTTDEGTITWERNQQKSTLDLTLISSNLTNRMILYERADDVQHDSDHYPIRSTYDISTATREVPRRRNWQATNNKALGDYLQTHLVVPDLTNATRATLELATVAFLSTIRHSIEESTPWAKPSTWANPDFDDTCKEAVKSTRYLRRVYSKTHTPRAWKAYCYARNRKRRLIKKALRANHRRRVQQATEQGPHGIWQLAKWARNRVGAYESGITPTLHSPEGTKAETVEEKASLFQQAFFPPAPEADLSDIHGYDYPEQINFPCIQKHEIETAIKAPGPTKAPGENTITNGFWQNAITVEPRLLDILDQIFNSCIRLGYNPTQFQRSITVVIRKAGEERDYRMPKAWRPIMLLDTLGKFLQAIVAKRISYAIETHGLLPPSHLGGRRGISVDHAIQLIIERIRKAWGKGIPVVTMLLLDVAGAYDNAQHARLLHNLKKRRLGYFVPWIESFLSNRSTRIRMPEGVSDRVPTPTGIPQGSPLSPILYLIYNADLLEHDEVTTMGWVDDVSFMATGMNEHDTTTKIEAACAQADTWARQHASIFDTKKYQLIHFVNPRSEVQPELTSIHLSNGTRIKAKKVVKYLGFWLDPGLLFKTHQDKAVAKAGKSLHALRGLSGSTWGIALSAMRRVYHAIIIPQMLYGAAAWFQPGLLTKKDTNAIVRQFATVQKRAAVLISGAFRTTAESALETELHLLPMRYQLDKLVKETALRIRTGPRMAVPNTMLIKRPDNQLVLGGFTPMEVHAWKKGGCLLAPPNTLAGRWESREAYIQEPWHTPPRVVIHESREEAIEAHDKLASQLAKHPNNNNSPIMIYTDGSGYLGYIGAAAVIPGFNRQRSQCIGTEGTSTVYAGEARGIEFALQMLLHYSEESVAWRRPAIVFADNQGILKNLRSPRPVSGQAFVKRIFDLLDDCHQAQLEITLQWIPGHENVPGNEAADRAAKRAALMGARRQVVPGDADPWLWLAAAGRQRVRQSAKDAWKAAWHKAKVGKPTRRLIKEPSKKTMRYWGGLRKATSSILIQLRTERIALNHYLWRINRQITPGCPCGLGGQTTRHILMGCPLHATHRQKMWEKIRGIRRTTEINELLSSKEAAIAVAQFMIDTGVLDQFRCTDQMALGSTEQQSHDQGTDVATRIKDHAATVGARSAPGPVRTRIDTSMGSGCEDEGIGSG
jgi:ribonuclease HI